MSLIGVAVLALSGYLVSIADVSAVDRHNGDELSTPRRFGIRPAVASRAPALGLAPNRSHRRTEPASPRPHRHRRPIHPARKRRRHEPPQPRRPTRRRARGRRKTGGTVGGHVGTRSLRMLEAAPYAGPRLHAAQGPASADLPEQADGPPLMTRSGRPARCRRAEARGPARQRRGTRRLQSASSRPRPCPASSFRNRWRHGAHATGLLARP